MKQNKGLFIGIAVVVVVVAVAVIAISSSSGKTTGSTSSASTSALSNAVVANAVNIQNYAFTPMVIKVKIGTTVTWTNKDQVHHNVVADTISADAPNGPLIGQGQSYSFTFKKAGTYTFYCAPHPYMHGIVEVTN